MKTTALALTLLCAAGAMPSLAQAQEAGATATLSDKDGNSLGTVTFKETPSGFVQVMVELAGVPAGAHGFHIHEKGSCDPAEGFKSAGGHYSGGMKHGILTEGGPHAGDLPNLNAGPDGVVKVEVFTDLISLDPAGKNPLKDADGSAVVLHANPDDLASQPAGEAGGRIACGVVE
ncbi:MAG: superoxide dismutase family protein [Mesorhizobium sp.]|jgi:superoxide dismutase, Cu-Zn family